MIYDFYIICKILILKKAIKSNKIIIKTIQIKYISDISSIGGYRQNFAKSYYGIKIVSNRKNYLYFYKNIAIEKLEFNIQKKLSNLKKVKVEVYKNTNVIKNVLANIWKMYLLSRLYIKYNCSNCYIFLKIMKSIDFSLILVYNISEKMVRG